MRFSPEIFGSSIVAVGAFNPAIFTPDWLFARNLIGATDCDAAKSSEGLLISSQVSTFETDWFHLQIVDGQFSLTSKGALTPAFSDLACGIFESVPHTPITAVGLNFLAHFKMGSDADYHRVGDTLAPKRVWRSVFPGENSFFGLSNLQVIINSGKDGKPSDSLDKLIIQIQPSSRVKMGVFLSSNDHRAQFASKSSDANAGVVSRIIRNDWDAARERAEKAFVGLISESIKDEG